MVDQLFQEDLLPSSNWRFTIVTIVRVLGCSANMQEIRHVLGSAARGGADGVPVDDPVTSLDMCVGCDCLVAGHGSGRVLLWDFLR